MGQHGGSSCCCGAAATAKEHAGSNDNHLGPTGLKRVCALHALEWRCTNTTDALLHSLASYWCLVLECVLRTACASMMASPVHLTDTLAKPFILVQIAEQSGCEDHRKRCSVDT